MSLKVVVVVVVVVVVLVVVGTHSKNLKFELVRSTKVRWRIYVQYFNMYLDNKLRSFRSILKLERAVKNALHSVSACYFFEKKLTATTLAEVSLATNNFMDGVSITVGNLLLFFMFPFFLFF